MLIKVDSSGQYCPFPGITVISNIQEKNRKIWEDIYDKLNKNTLIKKYYALLPVESYHMTTINLYTKRYQGGKEGKKWGAFIQSKKSFFLELQKDLEDNAFEPHVSSASLLKPHISKIISLIIPLDPSQGNKNQSIAKRFGLADKVPHPFHVTLAYSYKKIPDIELSKIQKQVSEALIPILFSYYQPILFKKPKINYFLDMTKYVEWNEAVKDIDI